MTEMVTSGSMSGEGKRGDGPLGESSNERKCSLQAPPVRTAAAPLLDSTASAWTAGGCAVNAAGRRRNCGPRVDLDSADVLSSAGGGAAAGGRFQKYGGR